MYFQVIHDRLTRQIGTGYKVYSHEWGDGGLRLPPQETERRSYLLGVQVRLRKDVERLRNIITRLQQSCESYTVVQIADIYKQPRSDSSKLGAFLNTTVRHLRKIGKVRLAETYTVMMNSFLRFRGEKGDVRWREIDTDLVKEYEYYLLEECGLELNTVSFYMRNLRAVYNRAVEKGLVEEKRFLFKHVYTGVRKTAKRAISPAILWIYPISRRRICWVTTCTTIARRPISRFISSGKSKWGKSCADTMCLAHPICSLSSASPGGTNGGNT